MRKSFDRTPLLVAWALLLLGAVAGVIWAFVTPYATVTVTASGVEFDAAQSARLFGGIPVFALESFLLGIVSALAVWFAMRRVRGVPGGCFAILLAACASFVALEVALRVGQHRFPDLTAQPGTYRVVGDLWLSDAV